MNSNSELQPTRGNRAFPIGSGGLRSLPFQFWSHWTLGYKLPFLFAFGLVVMLFVLLTIAMWQSPGPSVTWQHVQERETQELITHQFQSGPFALQTNADNAVVFEKLTGSDFAFQEWPVYAYFITVLVGLSFLLTVISCLSRFWFLLGCGFVIFFCTNLQLELLSVFGQTNQYAAISLIIVLVCTGLVFQYFFEAVGFGLRLLVYLIMVGGAFAALAFTAQIPNPVYFMAVSFIPATVIMGAFLAIFTGHELVTILILVVSRSAKGGNGFGHFLILSAIYLANLFAIYLSRLGWFTWEFSIHPILLLGISSILAVWGIMRQQDQMDGFMLPGPLAPLAILGATTIALSGATFFYTTANDAAIETITNMSLYAHIGFGLVFMLYIIANFAVFLKENRPVIQVLFKPKTMQFFTFRFAGTIAMLAFILYGAWIRPLYDTRGARDAAMGDYYVLTGDLQMAEGYYKKSDSYAFHNHHANFVLANIERLKQNPTKERLYYLNAAERRPTLQAYMNALNTLDQSPIYLYGYLKEIESAFPKSGVVNNALGLIYRKLNQPDSALYFFSQAEADGLTESTGRLNSLATAVTNNLALQADSISAQVENGAFGELANLYALANKQGVVLKRKVEFLPDTTLNVFTANYLANALLNQTDSVDTAFVSHAFKMATRPSNVAYREEVLPAVAHAAYKNGLINRAFQAMQMATVGSENRGKYNNTMALWALDQSAPGMALNYLQYAINQEYADARLTQAIAFSEVGRRGEAVVLFDSLRNQKDLAVVAESMMRILVAKPEFVQDLNDLEKYAYCRYRLTYEDSTEFQKTIRMIEDPNWRARAVLDRSKKLFAWDEVRASIELYNSFDGVGMSDSKLFEEIREHELLLQAVIGNVEFIKSKKASGWRAPVARQAVGVYYDALIAGATSDSVSYRNKLNWIAANNSFFDIAVVAAARATKPTTDKLARYSMLATAVQNNPHSARLLKAYVTEARRLEFDDFAQSGLQALAQSLPKPLYQKFVSSLQ